MVDGKTAKTKKAIVQPDRRKQRDRNLPGTLRLEKINGANP